MARMSSPPQFLPIYTSNGDAEAFLVYPYIYDRKGNWIGWVMRNRHVYSIDGNYVGWLSDEPRILRKQSTARIKPRLTPPPRPIKLDFPDSVPPMTNLSELKAGVFDVLLEAPDLLQSMENESSQSNIE
jgi:4-fold beta flower protein